MALGALFRPPMVGLDIGSGAVKGVVLRRGRGGWSLVSAAEVAVPESEVSGDSSPSAGAIGDSVGQLFDTLQLRRARVAAALSGHAVIVKRLSLPAMSQAELTEAIPWEAEQYIPFDLSEVQLDYQVVTSTGDAAKPTMDVLLVAAKRDRIDDRASIIAQSGRTPVVLDVEAFALANAYQMNYPEREEALTALIHVGRSATLVCLLEKSEPIFTRDISLGGQVHLDALQRELAGNALDALALKRILHGTIPPGISTEHVNAVLRDATAQLVLEIRKTIDFYRATAPVERLTRIVLSGGAWQAVGLADQLTQEFNAPVDIFDPFRRVVRPTKAIGADAIGPGYAVAVGLAMRQEGDR